MMERRTAGEGRLSSFSGRLGEGSVNSKSAFWAVVLALSAAFLLSGCAPRTINHILADPSRYSNKEVRIEGSVTESYSILGKGAYQIDDGTGKLWIVAQKGVPRQGARVTAKGKIKDGLNLGNIVKLPRQIDSGLVMIESSHKAKD